MWMFTLRKLLGGLKPIIKKNIYLTGVAYLIHNLRIRLKLVFGNISTSSGTTHTPLSTSESLDYIENVFKDYQHVSGCNQWSGTLAELGPGDQAGVACLFVANGIERADLADRFYSMRDHEKQKIIHDALQEKHPKVPSMNNDGTIEGIHRFYGAEASGEKFFKTHSHYDVIISRSVLEHVDEPEAVLENMYKALKPNGLLIHKVDLRDHGMMTPYSQDISYLGIPKWLYTAMVKGTGYPNRFLFHKYKEKLQALNPGCKFFVSGLFGVEPFTEIYEYPSLPESLKNKACSHIEHHRHTFAKEFKNVPAEHLMVSSFFFVCDKKM